MHQKWQRIYCQFLLEIHLLTMAGVELLVSVLKPSDFAYDLYVGMATFRPPSSNGLSELQSTEL